MSGEILIEELRLRISAFRSIVPALVVLLYFVIGFLAFSLRSLLWGVPHDREIESRGESILVSFYFRNYFVWIVRPLWRLLLASGLSANAVTGIAAAMGAGSGLAAATGRFALAGWLFLFSGILDVMDGRLARARRETGPAGQIIDSVLDRYADSILLLGLCWQFRSSWVLLPALAAVLGTAQVPYVRAKAEALGIAGHAGLMQRAERILYLGATLVLTPIFALLVTPRDPQPFPWLAAVGLSFLAVTTNLTAARRFVHLVRAAAAAGAPGKSRAELRSPKSEGHLQSVTLRSKA
jgi:phosphatidylglycerophosphate synthase